MKFYVKLVIFIVILFIIILLLRKKIPILKETFDNEQNLTDLHDHSNSKEDDDKSMNVILINFYFKDTCPQSREFLYGCCEDKEVEKDESGFYLEKNRKITTEGKHDSYLNRIFNWFKGKNANKIIKSDEYTKIPDSNTKCLSLRNFREEGVLNNKCKLEKRPTYYYLELFANFFNKRIEEDIIEKIISQESITNSNLNNINQLKTYLGVYYNSDKDNITQEILDIKFKIRLQVKEALDDNNVGSLEIEIPRYYSLEDQVNIEEGENINNDVVKTSHKFLGNINNLNEVMEFVNDYLNISIQDKLQVKKYLLNDEEKLEKIENTENWKYEFTFEANRDKTYELIFDDKNIIEKIEYLKTELELDDNGTITETIDSGNGKSIDKIDIKPNTIDNTLKDIKVKIFKKEKLTEKDEKDFEKIFEEIKVTITLNSEPKDFNYFTLNEIDPNYKVLNFFGNDLPELEKNYKKQLLIPNTTGKIYLNQTDYKDYIAYLYNDGTDFQEPKNFSGKFSKYKPNIVSYDFNQELRDKDRDNKYLQDNYINNRPRIIWRNLIDFPSATKNEFLAIIMCDKYLKESYNGEENDERNLIYWMIWNVPKSAGELNALSEDGIFLMNPEGNLVEGVRQYSEFYKYRILNKDKIQYYFDVLDRIKRDKIFEEQGISIKDYLTRYNNKNFDLDKYLEDNIPSPSILDPNIDFHQKRRITYNFEIFQYDKEKAMELDRIYQKNKGKIEVLYDEILTIIEGEGEGEEVKINKNDMTIDYPISETEELDKYLDNNDFEVIEGTYKENIVEKHLKLYSYGNKYYNFEEGDFVNIDLEKNTYWVLYFNLELNESKDEYAFIYINNDKIRIDSKKFEYRIPFQTNRIILKALEKETNKNIDASGSVVIKESRVPTYRLNWSKVFEEKIDSFKKTKDGIEVNTDIKNLEGQIKLQKSFKVGEEPNLKYKLNFYTDQTNITINEEKYERNKIYDSMGNMIKFTIPSAETILHNGTITPLEENNKIQKIENVNMKGYRISTIEIDTLSCDSNNEGTIQSVPTFKVELDLEGDSNMKKIFNREVESKDNLNLAIRIYKEDPLKPSYLEWGIPLSKDFINYEMFKYTKDADNYNSVDEISHSTKLTNNYHEDKINNDCQKIKKLDWNTKITIENLPIDDVKEFNYDNVSGNRFDFKEDKKIKYSIIFNNIKEKWQLWKKQIDSVYEWVGEQKYSEYLLISKSRWVFNPKYEESCDGDKVYLEYSDPREYPTWYNRHKEIMDFTKIYEKEINMETDGDQDIYDCNLKIEEEIESCPPDEGPAPDEGTSDENYIDLNFQNTLFNIGSFDKDEKVLFDFFNLDAYSYKDFRVEIIPYKKEEKVEQDLKDMNIPFNQFKYSSEDLKYEDLLSEKVKQRYINPNLISRIVKIIITLEIEEDERKVLFDKITNSLIINRGNLDTLFKYLPEDSELEKKILRLKLMFYSMEEESDIPEQLKNYYQNEKKYGNPRLTEINNFLPEFPFVEDLKRDPVIYTWSDEIDSNNTLDKKINFQRGDEEQNKYTEESDMLPIVFDRMINKNKIYFKNFTSYGENELYQNEVLLKYKIPIIKSGELCPVYRDYDTIIREGVDKEIIHKMNIIRILTFCNLIVKMYDGKSLNSDNLDTRDFNNKEITTSFFDNFKTKNNADNKGNLEKLIKEIQKIDFKLLDFKHRYKLSHKDTTYKLDDNDKLFDNGNQQILDKPKLLKKVKELLTDNIKKEVQKVKFRRDIYVQYNFANVIKTLNISVFANNIDNHINVINELLTEIEKMYIFCNQKYINYNPNETPISRSEGFGDEFTKLMNKERDMFTPPTTFTDTIDNSLQNYKSMIFNYLEPNLGPSF